MTVSVNYKYFICFFYIQPTGVPANIRPKIRAKTVLATLSPLSERYINVYDMLGNVDPQRTCGNMWMVSPTGIEPVTISLKGRCSTYWATGPHKLPFKCLLKSKQIKSSKIKIFCILSKCVIFNLWVYLWNFIYFLCCSYFY